MQQENQALPEESQQKRTKTFLRVSFKDPSIYGQTKTFSQVLKERGKEVVIASKSGKDLTSFDNDQTPQIEVDSAPVNPNKDLKKFKFDKILEIGATQDEVFGLVGKQAVDDILKNYKNVLILSMGACASGKTYTAFGYENEQWGLFPKILKEIFDHNRQVDTNPPNFEVRFQAYQAYHKILSDLQQAPPDQANLKLIERSKQGKVEILGLKTTKIDSYEQGMALFQRSLKNKFNWGTQMNPKAGYSNIIIDLELSYFADQEAAKESNQNENDNQQPKSN